MDFLSENGCTVRKLPFFRVKPQFRIRTDPDLQQCLPVFRIQEFFAQILILKKGFGHFKNSKRFVQYFVSKLPAKSKSSKPVKQISIAFSMFPGQIAVLTL
jgi:hypothetical protein